jgi:hypothetical protein
MRRNLHKNFRPFVYLCFCLLLTLSLNAGASNDADGLLPLNFRSIDKKAADEFIKLKDTIKISSNAHSNDAAALGIIFNWNVKQKDDGILTVASLPDGDYYSFDLIVQSSGTYTIARVDGAGAYEVTKNGKNINMVYIANAVLMQGGSLEFLGSEAIGIYYNDKGIAVENANRLAVATFWLAIDEGTPQFAGLNDFAVLDTALDNDLYRVTLGYLVAGGEGFTNLGKSAILAISGIPGRQTGAAGVVIVNARFVSYDDNGGAADSDYFIGGDDDDEGGWAGFHGSDDPGFDTMNYDLNGDGVVDQLDLAVALSFYMAYSGDANWNVAKSADFNEDGIVDIEDFILLLNNMAF